NSRRALLGVLVADAAAGAGRADAALVGICAPGRAGRGGCLAHRRDLGLLLASTGRRVRVPGRLQPDRPAGLRSAGVPPGGAGDVAEAPDAELLARRSTLSYLCDRAG